MITIPTKNGNHVSTDKKVTMDNVRASFLFCWRLSIGIPGTSFLLNFHIAKYEHKTTTKQKPNTDAEDRIGIIKLSNGV